MPGALPSSHDGSQRSLQETMGAAASLGSVQGSEPLKTVGKVKCISNFPSGESRRSNQFLSWIFSEPRMLKCSLLRPKKNGRCKQMSILNII